MLQACYLSLPLFHSIIMVRMFVRKLAFWCILRAEIKLCPSMHIYKRIFVVVAKIRWSSNTPINSIVHEVVSVHPIFVECIHIFSLH